MLDRVIACIDQHQLLPCAGKLVVGVSGGADSLCLIHLLHQCCGPGKHYPGVELQAAHLNHMLRGTEGDRDAGVVASLMKDWNIPCSLGKIDVPALAKREKRSLEDAARVARYRFLREVAAGQRIAVAHHADDQVETLLLHWLRGAGLAGMTGMQPRQGDIIRPLLGITHAEILAYCQEHKLSPLEDQSNRDPRFLRNRVRHELLPLLQQLNPAIKRTLLRSAEVARVDLEWLETQVDACWNNIVLSEREQAIRLDAHALKTLPVSLRHHLLRRVTARLCEGQSPLELRHFLLLERLLDEQANGEERTLHLPGLLRAVFQARYLSIERRSTPEESDRDPRDLEISLSIPGEAALPGTPWQVRVELVTEEIAQSVRKALRQENWPEVWRLLGTPDRWTVWIDGGTVGEQVQVRIWRPGDRVQPLGMSAEKKLQDIFVDKHIPRAERLTTPLFFSRVHCLWAAGACLDHRVRLTGKTRRILRLSIRPA